MNPEDLTPQEQIEARLTALLLGELPATEAESLRAEIAKDAELRALHERLRHTIELVRETVSNPMEQTAAPPAPMKLSEAKREKLLAQFKTIEPKEFETPSPRKVSWVLPIAAAAAVIILVTFTMLPNFMRARTSSQSLAIVNNLRQLDGAKQQWAMEQKAAPTAVPTFADLQPYLGRSHGEAPKPVAGEKYVLGAVSESPTAELGGKNAYSWFDSFRPKDTDSDVANKRVAMDVDGDLTVLAKNANTDFGDGAKDDGVFLYKKVQGEEHAVTMSSSVNAAAAEANSLTLANIERRMSEPQAPATPQPAKGGGGTIAFANYYSPDSAQKNAEAGRPVAAPAAVPPAPTTTLVPKANIVLPPKEGMPQLTLKGVSIEGTSSVELQEALVAQQEVPDKAGSDLKLAAGEGFGGRKADAFYEGSTRDDVSGLRYLNGNLTTENFANHGTIRRENETTAGGVTANNIRAGDPEWVGILDQPDRRVSGSNQFISRYAYQIDLNRNGNLDVNFIQNHAAQTVAKNYDADFFGGSLTEKAAVPGQKLAQSDVGFVQNQAMPTVDAELMKRRVEQVPALTPGVMTHRYAFDEPTSAAADAISGKQPQSGAGDTAAQLATRTYKVDPNTFKKGLEGVLVAGVNGTTTGGNNYNFAGGGGGVGGGGGGGGLSDGSVQQVTTPGFRQLLGGAGGNVGGGVRFVEGNELKKVNEVAKNFFTASGVDLDEKAGKSVQYDAARGELTVRGTATDLALVEQATQTLKQQPPPVNIRTGMAEVTLNDAVEIQRDAATPTLQHGWSFNSDHTYSIGGAVVLQKNQSGDVNLPTPQDAALAATAQRNRLPGVKGAEAERAAAFTDRLQSIERQPLSDSLGDKPLDGSVRGGDRARGVQATRDYPNATTMGGAQITYDPTTGQLVVVTDDRISGNIGEIIKDLDKPKPAGTQPGFTGPSNTGAGGPLGFFPGTVTPSYLDGTRPAANSLVPPGKTDVSIKGALLSANTDFGDGAIDDNAFLYRTDGLARHVITNNFSRNRNFDFVPEDVGGSHSAGVNVQREIKGIVNASDAFEVRSAPRTNAAGAAEVPSMFGLNAEGSDRRMSEVNASRAAAAADATRALGLAEAKAAKSEETLSAAKVLTESGRDLEINAANNLEWVGGVNMTTLNNWATENAAKEAKLAETSSAGTRLFALKFADPADLGESLNQLSKQSTTTLVQDGKVLLEAGRTDEAEARLREAVKNDPSNVAAYQYLKLADEQRVAKAAGDGAVLQNLRSETKPGSLSADLGADHPEAQKAQAIRSNIDRAIAMAKANGIDIDKATQPYWSAKYELDKLKRLRDVINSSRNKVVTGTLTPVPDYSPAQIAEMENQITRQEAEVNQLRTKLNVVDVDPQRLAQAAAKKVEQEPPVVKKPSVAAPVPQPEVLVRENAFSTFSLNVSDVSFKLAAASLEKGAMPDVAGIRTEEFINAFDYRDPEPPPGACVGFAYERARYPFAHNRDLLRFSVKTASAGRQAGRPMNIVLLLDNSGSMERSDRVRIIHEALRVLASQLGPQDKVSVVTFARTARLWVDGISGDKAGAVMEQAGGLTPEGGTNLEDAMNLAYATALRHYLANGANRVVLLTDGAANLGDVEPETLKAKVEEHRKQGVALDCFGIGWEGYNDDLLEVLSRNGDGRYGFINSPEEAATGFAQQLAGALQVAASDVKVQVEFNPKRVTTYRQIGYAKHQLKKEQFRDNTVDAAEIGAAESGNALYAIEVNPAGEGPVCTVRVRYKVPGTGDYREQAWTVPCDGNAPALEQSSPAMKLAGTASAFSEWLAQSPFAEEVTPDRLLACMSGVPEVYGADARPKKLEWMIRQAKSLSGK